MFHTVNKSHVQLIDNNLVCEASEIGLRPGEWPEFIGILDDENEGFLFRKGSPDVLDGELHAFRYRSRVGNHELLVIND